MGDRKPGRVLGPGVHDRWHRHVGSWRSLTHLSLGRVLNRVDFGAALSVDGQNHGRPCSQRRHGVGVVHGPVLSVSRGRRREVWCAAGHEGHVSRGCQRRRGRRGDGRMEAPGRWRNVQRRCRDIEGLFVVVVEAGQLGQPVLPLVLGGKEVVAHVAQKLDFHDVNLVDGEAGHFRPRLVSVSVVVED